MAQLPHRDESRLTGPSETPVRCGVVEESVKLSGIVLVVDDEVLVRRLCERQLSRAGLRTLVADSHATGTEMIREHALEIDVVLTDLRLGEESGMDILATARAEAPEAVVIVMTAAATVPIAVAAMRAGAYDFLVKPFEPPETLVRAVERALERKRLVERNRFLETQVDQAALVRGIVGDSVSIRRVLSLVEAVAPVDSTVLILGESGTGKELIARALHERSRRAERPFLAINCGALAESVLESELFGHARGAFTGAVGARKGLFEEATTGTLFLDEVGEMPPSIQVRLLRVIEEREVRPVGSNETRKVDVRLIAATNRNLAAATRAGTFREDLFYRLNVVSIDAPPLRDRASDIPLLAHHFLALYAKKLDKNVKRIQPDALQVLCAYNWPGNVRELQNAIERAVLLAKDDVITVEALPPSVGQMSSGDRTLRRPYTLPLAAAIHAFERSYIEHTLLGAHGNVAEAARTAGVDRSNFRRLVRRHGIDAAELGDKRESGRHASGGQATSEEAGERQSEEDEERRSDLRR
jgi:two-component system, NtrC family, response regulator HydG